MNSNDKNIKPLNGSSPIPLYIQLKKGIIEQLKTGKLAYGSKLPSELEIASNYGVSRNTVRTALLELSDEGYLIRKQGKGTFVKHQIVEENISTNISFTEVCIANGLEPGHRLISIALQPASQLDIEELGVNKDDRIVFIERVLYGNQIPVVLDRTFFPEKYSALLGEKLDGVSLYETISSLFGITMLRSRKTIELAFASDDEALYLNVRKDSPVLLMTETVFDESGQPVHRGRQIILGDRFKYVVY